MDAATRAELAALRRRAYGPDADIAADPAALERLIELEARALEDQHVMVDSARALAPVGPDTDADGLAAERDRPSADRAGPARTGDAGRARTGRPAVA